MGARMLLDPKCEDVLNTQANIEMTVSMVYLALHHHFAADAVSLPGLAAHFLKESEGGLGAAPVDHDAQDRVPRQPPRGRAVRHGAQPRPREAQLREAPRGARAGEAAGDSQLMDFVESEFLDDQLNSIKEISDWV